MKIVVPMSGAGRRFVAAGYREPKPLVRVEGRTMIEHVVALFPRGSAFVFVCNAEHLATSPLAATLEGAAPGCEIVSIAPHRLGPVHAVLAAADRLPADGEVLVNYCDFSKTWDCDRFLARARSLGADAALTAYRGFHPHLLDATSFARVRAEGPWVREIREKQPAVDEWADAYVSDGTYWFRRGADLVRTFRAQVDRGLTTQGEYYVSTALGLLAAEGRAVLVDEIEHMLQWGTPEDLCEYQAWSRLFARRAAAPEPSAPPVRRSVSVLPLAGRGARFAAAGFELPKPLVPVDGQPMVVAAAACLPPAERWTFVARTDHLRDHPLAAALDAAHPGARVVGLEAVTDGQAASVACGLDDVPDDAPLFVGASDHGMHFDRARYAALASDPAVDAIVLTFRGRACVRRAPSAWGYVDADATGRARAVSVKVPLGAHPERDAAIVGAFRFRRADVFRRGLAALRARGERVNGEYYVDSVASALVGMGAAVHAFDVDDYVGWGTPDEWRAYGYWQRFFDRCPWHPYARPADAPG